MKLNSPRKIQQNISYERKNDIDQGIKIARKVDELREELGALETRKVKYIQGTIGELEKQLKELLEEIEEKKYELKSINVEIEKARAKEKENC